MSLAQRFGLVHIGAAAQLLGLVVGGFIKPIAYIPSTESVPEQPGISSSMKDKLVKVRVLEQHTQLCNGKLGQQIISCKQVPTD